MCVFWTILPQILVFLLQGFCDIACGIDSKAEEQKSDVIISIQGFS